jgi:dephospho-CoA kinase
MLRVALTGGIATGKSYVRARFEMRGLPTIDADAVARAVVAPGTEALARIRDRFGDEVTTADGALDRKALAAIVFGDAAQRLALEAIVHPAVRAAIDGWMDAEAARGTPVAVADIPLLFETGRAARFDIVVVAACDAEEQVRRVMRRDGATAEEARARLAAQWPIDRKVRLAHYVIRTDGPFAETDRLTDEVVSALRRTASPH